MRPVLLLLALAACAEPPTLGARVPAAERAAPPAALRPLGPVLAAADALPAEPAFAPGLRAGAADLQARAAAIPATSLGAAEAERLAALQARAEALRQAGLTQAERDRLLSAAP